jgi:hypothetical protein
MHVDAQVDDTKRKRVDTKAWAEKFVLLKNVLLKNVLLKVCTAKKNLCWTNTATTPI